MMTVRPPSVMLAVPVMALRRETLLPESWWGAGRVRDGGCGGLVTWWGFGEWRAMGQVGIAYGKAMGLIVSLGE